MKFLSVMYLLFCASSVGNSLKCFSCNTDKPFCPPRTINCPPVRDPVHLKLNEDKCLSMTKNHRKYKGCHSYFERLSHDDLRLMHWDLRKYDVVKIFKDPSTHSICDTDLCNGSGKFSNKNLIVSIIAGVVFAISQLLQ